MENITEKKQISIVIPYVQEFAQGNELRNALRSIEENFKDEYQVFVIGDKPKWLSNKAKFISCPRKGGNPPIDIALKMQKLIETDEITEDFIWSNDDIYFWNPVYTHDIAFIKAIGNMGERSGNQSTLYKRNFQKTITLLKQLNLPTRNYATHLPVMYNKSKLNEIIVRFNLTEDAHLIGSLYFNYFYPDVPPFNLSMLTDNITVGCYRANPDYELLLKLLPNKKFFNHSQTGFTSRIAQILDERFPIKSKFEK